MRKIALILLFAVILIIVIAFALNKCAKPADAVDTPDISKAHFIVCADNRYYYFDKYEILKHKVFGDYLLLHGYWDSKDGKEWVYHKQDLKLSYRAYPDMTPSERVPKPTPAP